MRGFKLLIVVAAVCVLGSMSQASTIDATLTGVAWGGIDMTVTVAPHNGNSQIQVNGIAGLYQWQESAGDTPVLGNNGVFDTFCVELSQDIELDQAPYAYTLTALSNAPQSSPNVDGSYADMGTADATEISELWGQDFSKVTSATTAAEFQVAVWDVIYGSSYLTVSGTGNDWNIMNTSKSWLSSLTSAPTASLTALSSPTYQDQVTLAPPGTIGTGPTGVPLPSVASTGYTLLGGVGLFWAVRSRRKSLATVAA